MQNTSQLLQTVLLSLRVVTISARTVFPVVLYLFLDMQTELGGQWSLLIAFASMCCACLLSESFERCVLNPLVILSVNREVAQHCAD